MSTTSGSGASSASLTSEGSRLRTSDPRILVLFAILLGYVLWPILQVLGESFWVRGKGPSLDPWIEFLERGHLVYAWRSLTISLATVALSGIFGTALAFLYFRLEFPGRAILSGLALLPFTLPPLVGVFAIWTLMGEDGLFHQFTRSIYGDGLWLDKGYGGVLLIHTYSMYVYFYVLVGGALAGFDESQIEAARDLGATRWKTMTRIVAPQLAPALAGASLLTFMTSMASFTAPFFYMAGRPVLTVGIQQAWENSMPGLASADCVVLALCAGIFLYLILKFEKTIQGGTRGAPRRRVEVRSLSLRFSITLGAMALTLVLLAPHIAMVREALVKPGTGFVGIPVEYSVVNFLDLWRKDQSWAPILTSLKAAGLATFAVILFTLFSSWVIVRREFRGKALMRWLVMVPWALPGTVIAIGLLWISRSANLLTLGVNIRGTIQILALAYFIRLMPLAHRTIAAGLSRVSKELEGAGRDLGAGPLQSFLRITLPLILPAVIAAATLTFATAMGEFVSSILLTGFENEPISVKIFELRRERVQLAAAYSTILLAMITLTFAVFGRRLTRAM